MKQPEFILCAAINYDGNIVCGHRHGDCYELLKSIIKDIDNDKLPDRDSQGFLTSENRYVSRQDAWVIAKKNKQIIYGLKASDRDNEELETYLGITSKPESMLISENLY